MRAEPATPPQAAAEPPLSHHRRAAHLEALAAVASDVLLVTESSDTVSVYAGWRSRIDFLFSLGAGRRGAAQGEFRQPSALAFWGGEVFVADTLNHRVQVGCLAPPALSLTLESRAG